MLEDAIAQAVAVSPETDLLTALRLAAEQVADAPGRHTILVVDSGLSTTGALSFRLDGMLAADPADVVASLQTAGALPDLSGVHLVFHGLAVRNTARFTPAVFRKDKDARHDWEVFAELASRVSARLDRPPSLRKRLAQRARLAVSPTVQIAGLLASGRKVSMRRLRAHPEGIDLGPLRPTMPELFPSP